MTSRISTDGLCQCGCGRRTTIATANCTRDGYVKGQPKRFVNGHFLGRRDRVKHGFSRRGQESPEYKAYRNAKYRCTNPNSSVWERYGGRGIKFLFTSFEQFMACIGPRPAGGTLDRINNDGHYAPGNVRWATPAEQANNRRPPHAEHMPFDL